MTRILSFLCIGVLTGTTCLTAACQAQSASARDRSKVPAENPPTDSPEPDPASVLNPAPAPDTDRELTAPLISAFTPDEPVIEIQFAPPRDVDELMTGRVYGIDDPDEYAVSVVIYVPGWGYVRKPTHEWPTVPIALDGSWSADFVTGGEDSRATELHVFLIKANYEVPHIARESTIPQSLIDAAVARDTVYREGPGQAARTVEFADQRWTVKSSTEPVGPGPNVFEDAASHCYVDSDGALHLRLAQTDGVWCSSEVIAEDVTGYGTYTWTVATPATAIASNCTAGFFIWSENDATPHNNELDIEFARWGDERATTNAQFALPPFDQPGQIERFTLPSSATITTLQFTWSADRIEYAAWIGTDTNVAPHHTWTYTGAHVPKPDGAGQARINLWLYTGAAPATSKPVELIVRDFRFTPAS